MGGEVQQIRRSLSTIAPRENPGRTPEKLDPTGALRLMLPPQLTKTGRRMSSRRGEETGKGGQPFAPLSSLALPKREAAPKFASIPQSRARTLAGGL